MWKQDLKIWFEMQVKFLRNFLFLRTKEAMIARPFCMCCADVLHLPPHWPIGLCALCLKLMQQLLCVSQLTPWQPCILSSNLIFIALLCSSLTNNFSDFSFLLFKCGILGLRLLKKWKNSSNGRTHDCCYSRVIFVDSLPIWMLRVNHVRRGRLVHKFDGWLWSVESIKIIEGLWVFPWVRAEVHSLNLRLNTGGLDESTDFVAHNTVIKYERVIWSMSEDRHGRWSEILFWGGRARLDCRQPHWMNLSLLYSHIARSLREGKVI